MKKSAEIENKICVFVNNILIQETMSLTPLHLWPGRKYSTLCFINHGLNVGLMERHIHIVVWESRRDLT